MTPAQRLQAAQKGRLTLGEMLRWTSRAPREVSLVGREFFLSPPWPNRCCVGND